MIPALLYSLGVILPMRSPGQYAYTACSPVSYLAPHPTDCTKFLACATFGNVVMDCPASLFFDEPTQRCEYPYKVTRCKDSADRCSTKPCVRGNCIPTFAVSSGYVCQCPVGYQGDTCSEDVDECRNSPCTHGVCVNTPGSYTCNCQGTGYGGRLCESRLTTGCLGPGLLCQHGTCEVCDTYNVCNCEPGYTGALCDQVINTCDAAPCLNGGICTDLGNNGFSCDCNNTGYTGDTCERVNPCSTSPCRNNGRCSVVGNTFSCDCLGTGYTGSTCSQAVVTPCTAAPCQNGGVCSVQGSGYTCDCSATAFVGPTCTQVGTVLVPGTGCSLYPCPSDIPRYSYPVWADTSCRQYINCEYGVIRSNLCPLGQKFDVITMECKPDSSQTAAFCSIFVR